MDAGDDFDGANLAETRRAGVGEMLRARRVELGMTHADVANAVKLPARRIEAMEEERWDELPDGPYLRGFLRNVARALQLDATTLLDRIDVARMRTRSPESILVAPRGTTRATLPKRNGPIDDRSGGRKLVFGAFLFAIVAALIAWSGTESFDHALAGGQALIARRDDVPAAPRGTAPAAVVDAQPAPAADQAASTPVPTPTAVDPAAPAPATPTPPAVAGDLALVFHFNEDSWVEVKSADGRVLLHRLNVAGSEQKIDGEAPFSLIVGNAKGVALRFRGQPVDLGPYTRDQVARLTLS